MTPIIEPIDKEIIKAELTPARFLRPTNKAGNEIYIINGNEAPNTMREIGRLRELSFRNSGGGSGEELDVDDFDFLEKPYQQIIVWNPEEEEIIGGYRYIHGHDTIRDAQGQPLMPIAHLFEFSEAFLKDYLPISIELGRAFVQPKYQSAQMKLKSLFALDNLWDGIGALLANFQDVKYLIGKVTIYSQMNEMARYAICYFLNRFYPDNDKLFIPQHEVTIPVRVVKQFDKMFVEPTFRDNFRILNAYVKNLGESVPALIHAYIELSPSMRTFGTCLDTEFGNIYDTGMMITVDDIYQAKKERYVESYINIITNPPTFP